METNNNQTPSSSASSNTTIMAILAYIGPLVIVSYLVAKDDQFVKFHIKQGLLLFIASVIVWIVSSSLWHFFFLINIVNLGIFVLAVIGIINVLNKQTKELPLVGHLASNFKF